MLITEYLKLNVNNINNITDDIKRSTDLYVYINDRVKEVFNNIQHKYKLRLPKPVFDKYDDYDISNLFMNSDIHNYRFIDI